MRRFQLLQGFLLASQCLLAGELEDQYWAAARSGDLAAVKAALDQGAPVDAKTRHGVTALFYAAQNGHTEVVTFLIGKGADVNVKDTFYGMTALQRAAGRGQAEVVKLMIERGATGVESALTSAVFSKKASVLQAVLETGKADNKALATAMQAAINSKNTEAAALLKKAGASEPEAPKLVEVDAAVLRRYEGRYLDPRGNEMTLSVREGKLSVTPAGGQPMTLGATSHTTFVPASVQGVTLRVLMEGEAVTGLEINQMGNTNMFRKAPGQ
jgi:ankyrin repeat protein